MSPQELQVQEKREVERQQEATVPARAFLPPTDIFESDDVLTLVMEMPGVDREAVDVNVENGVLRVENAAVVRAPQRLYPRLEMTLSTKP